MRADLTERVFCRHPHELKIIELDFDKWLEGVSSVVEAGVFAPRAMYVVDVPKAKGAIRTGAFLGLSDHLVYSSCVAQLLPSIYERLKWSQGTVDFAYTLVSNPGGTWFGNRYRGWKAFTDRSLAMLSEGYSHVVNADLVSFYDTVDLSLLASELKDLGADKDVLKLQSLCLNRWAQVPGRGIPQGISASDVLAKVYLDGIDRQLVAEGFPHIRYVDDIRIFCRSEMEAKRALVTLIKLTRMRGLHVQSSKSAILNAADARCTFESVVTVIAKVKEDYVKELIKLSGWEDGYISMSELEGLAEEEGVDQASSAVVRAAFMEYFGEGSQLEFDKSLFHFLLNRLAKNLDVFAIDRCKVFLYAHPEETGSILSYIGSVQAGPEFESVILDVLSAENPVYHYQLYQMVEWLSGFPIIPGPDLVAVVRNLAMNNGNPPYLRAVCRDFVGSHGLSSDLELLSYLYPEAGGDLEQAEIICSVRRMEPVRRNGILARIENDGEYQRRAVRLVREGRLT